MGSSAGRQARKLTRFGYTWIFFITLYSAVRSLVVAKTLSQYGINPFIFFFIDVGSAVPYGLGQVRLIQSIRQRSLSDIKKWLAVVALGFLAPYSYLFTAGVKMPTMVYFAIILLMLIFAGAAAQVFVRKLKKQP